MYLTEANYYSKEANQEYLSVSQYKDFCGSMKRRGCEAKALAKLNGEWVDEMTEPLLLGSYVDAHFEGSLGLFKAHHPEIFRKSDSELLAKFQKADRTIQQLENDEIFMLYMSGEKQTILTGELFGAKWKCKLDSYLKRRAIVDLKYVKDLHERFYVKDEGTFVSFVEWWGYDIQAAVYREIEAINSGGERLPVYLAVADKQKFSDHEIVGFREDGADFKPILNEIERNVPRILDLKSGKVEPDRCGVCDYCRATKKITVPVYYRELIEV